MFRSSGGALYGGGQVSKMDEHVGCYGPNAITIAKGNLVWSDQNGVYSTTGNLVVSKISQGIDSFFNGYFASPLQAITQQPHHQDILLRATSSRKHNLAQLKERCTYATMQT